MQGLLVMNRYEWVIVCSVAGCVGCATFVVMEMIRHARMVHDAARSEVVLTDTTSGMIRSFLPLARTLGLGVRVLLGRGKKNGLYATVHYSIQRKLFSAGNPQGINADEYVGFGLLWGFGAGLIGVVFHLLLEMEEMVDLYTAFLIWALMALIMWRSWLSRKKEERQGSIRKTLPFSLDLLTLSMEAGLDFTAALRRMVRKIGKSPLGQEFSLMLHEIQLGKSRSQALRDFATRADVPEVRSVVASLIQAEELGASLGPILRIQAAQQRERRSQRAEEKAMKAPVKMLFPLTVFIFPTVLIMIFTPIALRVFGS